MKASNVFGVLVALLVGAMGGWGVYAYLSLKAQLETAQKELQATPTPQIVAQAPAKTASSAPALQPSPTPSVEAKFEDLPLCDQLDAIARAKKSVAQFIVDSGRYEEFAAQINTKCTWNAAQLQQADAILHPPPVQIAAPESSSRWRPAQETEPSARAPVQRRREPWNNCNGILEPGESYTFDCRDRQRDSDRAGTPGPGDNRSADMLNGPYDGGHYRPEAYSSGESSAPQSDSLERDSEPEMTSPEE